MKISNYVISISMIIKLLNLIIPCSLLHGFLVMSFLRKSFDRLRTVNLPNGRDIARILWIPGQARNDRQRIGCCIMLIPCSDST